MLSAARSRLAVLVQLGFLGINCLGLLFSAIYTSNVPDLYEGNVHHTLGWILVWVVVAQCIMAVIKLYADRSRLLVGYGRLHDVSPTPISAEAMAQHHQMHATLVQQRGGYTDDAGNGTTSETPRTNSMSGTTDCGDEFLHDVQRPQDADSDADVTEKRSLLGSNAADRFLSNMRVRRKLMSVINAAYQLVNYSILLLGFVGITTGVVVYGGIFVSFACASSEDLQR